MILPLLAPITIFVILIGFVNAIGMFEPVWMLTGGGPAEATKTLPLFIHETFFRYPSGWLCQRRGDPVPAHYACLFALIAT